MTPSVEMTKKAMRQRRGPAIKITGALIAKTEFEIKTGVDIRMEVWQTEGVALIAVSETEMEPRAAVIEPGDKVDMHCAVMDACDRADRARSMLRDQLKWKFVREVP